MDIAESIAERKIREAMERGEFSNLEGHGKPIADLDRTREPGWFAARLVERELRRQRQEVDTFLSAETFRRPPKA